LVAGVVLDFAGGKEESPERERAEVSGQRKDSLPWARAGEGIFKNELWAHRTVYSACPVHTGQRIIAVR
jgi:hypothetical protein